MRQPTALFLSIELVMSSNAGVHLQHCTCDGFSRSMVLATLCKGLKVCSTSLSRSSREVGLSVLLMAASWSAKRLETLGATIQVRRTLTALDKAVLS